MKWIKTLVLILTMLTVGLIAALAQNQTEVKLSFAIWETPFPLSIFWWMLAAMVFGVVVGVVYSMWASIKRRLELRKLRQSLAQANAELERLRNLTLQG